MPDEYNVSLTSGGQLIPHLNRLSTDGHYSITFFNNHITIYSIQSRLAIRTFHEIPGLTFSNIVDTCISPINNNLIYVATHSKVFIINWYDNVKIPLVSTISLSLSLSEKMFDIVKIINFQEKSETVVNLLLKAKKQYAIVSYDLDKNEILRTYKVYENIQQYAVSSNLKNLAFSNSSGAVQVFTFDDENTAELTSFQTTYNTSGSQIVKIAVSNDQTDPLLAIGTSHGPVILLFDLLSSKPTQRTLKWHIEPVKALTFNHDQSYLLTGGSEKVLVYWNIITEKQQFLPRLNGVIEDIQINYSVPSLVGLSLNVIDNDFQYIVLGTTDLLSKLDINTPHIYSGLNKNNQLFKNIQRDVSSFNKSKQFTKIKHDYKLGFRIHPSSNHLYLPAGRHLQIYDYLHNTQIDNLAVAPAIQQYGKVGIENKISDPMVVGFEFIKCAKTNSKDWLVTCDVEIRGEAEDITNPSIERWETLRFWRNSGGNQQNDKLAVSDSWSLQTKMLRPHDEFQITSINPAPDAYFGGEALLTADVCGNVKLWRPNSQGIWSLRKFYSSGSEFNNSTAPSKKAENATNIINSEGTLCSWSSDGSMIAVRRNGKVILLDVNTFEPIHTIEPAIHASRFHTHASIDGKSEEKVTISKPKDAQKRYIDMHLQDNHLQSIDFTSNGKLLVIQARTHLCVVDILKNRVIFGLLLSGEGGKSGYGGSFVRLVPRSKRDINDEDSTDLEENTTDELMVVGKYMNSKGSVKSKVTLWNISDKKSTIDCKWCYNSSEPIVGAEWSPAWGKWIIIDIKSNIGEIGFGTSTRNELLVKSSKEQEENWIVSSLLDNARTINRATTISVSSRKNSDGDGAFNDRVGLHSTAFDGILDNLEGVSVSTLFERVLKVV